MTKKIQATISGIIDDDIFLIVELGMPLLKDKEHTKLKTKDEIKHAIQSRNFIIENKGINIQLSEDDIGIRTSLADFVNISIRLKKDDTIDKIEIGDSIFFIV